MFMIVQITAPGWEGFTGSLGFEAVFEDGVSVVELTPRQVSRIGSSLTIIDVATGLQVGPAADLANMRLEKFEVLAPTPRQDVIDQEEKTEKERLFKEAGDRAKVDAEALVTAQAKAEASVESVVIYTRVELEAIGSNDGIQGLRDIAQPLGVKARAISEMISEILSAQSKLAVT
jgi:hypothetical protein